jgi:hypothetical protein
VQIWYGGPSLSMGAPASYTYVILVSGVNNTSEEIKPVP